MPCLARLAPFVVDRFAVRASDGLSLHGCLIGVWARVSPAGARLDPLTGVWGGLVACGALPCARYCVVSLLLGVRAAAVPAALEWALLRPHCCSRRWVAVAGVWMLLLALPVGCFSPSRVGVIVCGLPTQRTVHRCRCRACACARAASRRVFCVAVRGCVQRTCLLSERIPCRGCRCPCGRAHTRLRRLSCLRRRTRGSRALLAAIGGACCAHCGRARVYLRL